MRPAVLCEGAPRDLGLDQGTALRPAIRDWAARNGASSGRGFWSSIRPLASGAVLGQGVGREVLRHYPHSAERMDGIARGAEVSLEAVMRLSIASDPLASNASANQLSAYAALTGGESTFGLTRSLPYQASPGCQWIVRRSLPEIGFNSVEVTLPWLVSAVAGVNEKGLAVAILPEPDERPGVTSAPPAILLVQDCLQRFADLESALGWCAGRPAAAGASILMGDESGDSAAVLLGPKGCRVVRSDAGEPQAIVRGSDEERVRDLHKQLEAGDAPLDLLLSAGAGGAAVHLNPRERSLSLWLGDIELRVASAEPDRAVANEQVAGTPS